MPKFLMPTTDKIEYKAVQHGESKVETHLNKVINIDAIESFCKGTWKKGLFGIEIRLNGCLLDWYFETESERDANFDAILAGGAA